MSRREVGTFGTEVVAMVNYAEARCKLDFKNINCFQMLIASVACSLIHFATRILSIIIQLFIWQRSDAVNYQEKLCCMYTINENVAHLFFDMPIGTNLGTISTSLQSVIGAFFKARGASSSVSEPVFGEC